MGARSPVFMGYGFDGIGFFLWNDWPTGGVQDSDSYENSTRVPTS